MRLFLSETLVEDLFTDEDGNMKRIALIVCWMTVLTLCGTAQSNGGEERQETLSPYFFIDAGDEGIDCFPLKKTTVDVSIVGVIAEVTVRQTYANMGSIPIHGTYIFPGSTGAAVHGMKMVIGERVIQALIKEKSEAKKTFEKAKKEGKNAALLEQKRPNVFRMEIANVMPGDTVEVELRYTELLVPDDGTYEFIYPTVTGPRYRSSSDNTSEAADTWIRNPYLKQGRDSATDFDISVYLAAGMKLQELSCPSHDTVIDYVDDSRAHIRLSDPATFSGNRDYLLRYRLADREISTGLLLEEGGEEHHFLLMAQPPERVKPELIPPREYTFVVDVSGSMHGFPLNTAKCLLEDLVSSLRPTDLFNLLFFAGDSQVMSAVPVPATPDNIDRAVKMIESSSGGGGTELLKAVKRAFAFPRRDGVARTLVVVTDGYIAAEKEVFDEISNNLDHTNVFAFGIGSSVNRYLIEGIARAGMGEPFIVTTPGEVRSVARKFRDYIASPVLTDIQVRFEGADVYDVEPPAVADLFARRPVVVFGKWRGAKQGTVILSGKNGAGLYQQRFSFADTAVEKNSEALGYLWARSRIARISDHGSGRITEKNREKVVELGCAYNLLTAYTSFVAVDEIIRNPEGEGKMVKQPLPLPKNVSNLAVGGGMNHVPEPELILLAVLLAGLLLFGWFRRQRRACSGTGTLFR